jgi:hypothetical protein
VSARLFPKEWYYLSSQHFDTENIQGLTPDILRTHVNNAFHAKLGADSCSRNTVLSSAGFCDDSGFPNAPCK